MQDTSLPVTNRDCPASSPVYIAAQPAYRAADDIAVAVVHHSLEMGRKLDIIGDKVACLILAEVVIHKEIAVREIGTGKKGLAGVNLELHHRFNVCSKATIAGNASFYMPNLFHSDNTSLVSLQYGCVLCIMALLYNYNYNYIMRRKKCKADANLFCGHLCTLFDKSIAPIPLCPDLFLSEKCRIHQKNVIF